MKRFSEIIRTDEKVSPHYIVANKFKFFFNALREWLNIYIYIKKINNGFKIHWILKKISSKCLRSFYDDAEVSHIRREEPKIC